MAKNPKITTYGPGPVNQASPLMGHKGKQLLSTSYVYAPYIPLTSCPTINVSAYSRRHNRWLLGNQEFTFDGTANLIQLPDDGRFGAWITGPIMIDGIGGLITKDGILFADPSRIIDPKNTRIVYLLGISIYYIVDGNTISPRVHIATDGDVYWRRNSLYGSDTIGNIWPNDESRLSREDQAKIHTAIAAWNEEHLTDRDGQDG